MFNPVSTPYAMQKLLLLHILILCYNLTSLMPSDTYSKGSATIVWLVQLDYFSTIIAIFLISIIYSSALFFTDRYTLCGGGARR